MSTETEAVVLLEGQLPYLKEVAELLSENDLTCEIVRPDNCKPGS